jgi:hypothetical protein
MPARIQIRTVKSISSVISIHFDKYTGPRRGSDRVAQFYIGCAISIGCGGQIVLTDSPGIKQSCNDLLIEEEERILVTDGQC